MTTTNFPGPTDYDHRGFLGRCLPSYWLPAHWYRPRYSMGFRTGYAKGMWNGRRLGELERNALALGGDAQRLRLMPTPRDC
jgi:hypothetical protein